MTAQSSRPGASPDSAVQQYVSRLDARRAARDALTAADARSAHARLGIFAAGVLLAMLVWRSGISPWSLLVPIAVFIWLLKHHARVLHERERATRGIAFYERGLARLEDRWAGGGDPGDRFRDDGHVYANDLDLFGRGSLFELLSLARTHAGEAILARWLTSPATAPEIRARQAAVEELAPSLDLRELLAQSGADARSNVRTDRLLEWAESPMPPTRLLRVVVWVFTVAVLLAIGYLVVASEWWLIIALLLAHGLVLRRFRGQMDTILSAREPGVAPDFTAEALTHRALELGVLGDLLTRLEEAEFRGNRLVQLQARLVADGSPASRVIRQLQRLSELYESQRNTAVLPIILFLAGWYASQYWLLVVAIGVFGLLQLVRPQIAVAVDRWRTQYGPSVRVWIDTIAEFEALSSLAGYRYENPGDAFPEIVEGVAPTRALFEGEQLGHPLLPRATVVRNDVCLAGATRLLVVSGSNMSGKSTLLRTVGINAVLALAGAPVRASSLRLSPVAIGATMRIQDSLLDGRSRFYAEITRIRKLSDIAAGPVPLLFLLDELFHGTNSHDRLLGAQGVLRGLLDRGAAGLITTHDLALTAIAGDLAPRAVNVHFEDWFEGNEMRFDYRMKPGAVARSNALALMRAVGLELATRDPNGSTL